MPLCAFIGDEVSAAGFRLAGVAVQVLPTDQAATRALDLFRHHLQESQFVLLTAEVASLLPPDLLARSLRADRPPVLVIPDVRGRVQPPDLASVLRDQLGMATG